MALSKHFRQLFHTLEARFGFKRHILAALPFWIGAALTATIAVSYARLFALAESYAMNFYEAYRFGMFLTAPACLLLSYLIVQRFAPGAGGSGIPQLMAASELAVNDKRPLSRFLGLRVMLIKIASSLLACLGGGAIGREGPTLQIAGSVFYLIRRSIPASWGRPSLQVMILAGGGAGLAAAFNTPLGGIVYVVEELSKVHISSFRTSLLQSVIIAGLVAQGFMGPYLYLGYPVLGEIDSEAILAALVIGAAIGAAGSLFALGLKHLVIWRSKWTGKRAYLIQAVTAGLAMALLVFFSSHLTIGSGKEVLSTLLFQGPELSHADIAGRFLGPLVTYSAGGAGGIFAPSLAAGAGLASLFHPFFPVSLPLLALLGMVAFLTAVTQTPFTSFVLVLEMTDRHSALFPMMVASMIAHIVSKILSKHSFYDFIKDRQLADFEESQSDPRSPLPSRLTANDGKSD
jgi:H+/Cl- antiporter ClcA